MDEVTEIDVAAQRLTLASGAHVRWIT